MNTVARRCSMLLVIVLATAACTLTNTGDPNVAAIVGDIEVPAATIDEQFETVSSSASFAQQAQQDTSGQLAAQAQSQLVTSAVRSAILRLLAERNDVQVTDAQVDRAVNDIVEQVGGREEFQRRLREQGVPRELFLQQVRDQEIQTALQQQVGADADFAAYVRETIAGVPIEVNPRYGRWNSTGLEVQPFDPLAPEGAPQGAGAQGAGGQGGAGASEAPAP